MAESARQEIEIPFAGKTYRIRPTWQVLRDVEMLTGQPCRSLGIKMLSVGEPSMAQATLTEIVAVMSAVIGRESGMTPDQIGEALVDDGYGELMLPLGMFLTRAQRGNKEHERLLAKEAAEVAELGSDRPRIRVKAA